MLVLLDLPVIAVPAQQQQGSRLGDTWPGLWERRHSRRRYREDRSAGIARHQSHRPAATRLIRCRPQDRSARAAEQSGRDAARPAPRPRITAHRKRTACGLQDVVLQWSDDLHHRSLAPGTPRDAT